ncbi:MAG: hypothetical protein ABIU85_01465 [Methylotenera sp.]
MKYSLITLLTTIVLLTGCIVVPPGHDPHGPGNSENAPGHNKHGGPGNSDDAPGHNK